MRRPSVVERKAEGPHRSVVLLRAVNVGGTVLSMERFRRALERAGWSSVRTLGAAGSAVAASPGNGPASVLEPRIESELGRVAGIETDAFVRTALEWRVIVRNNPFSEMATTDPAHLVVVVWRATPEDASWLGLRKAIVGREQVAAGEHHAYVTYPDGIGRSKLTMPVIERQLGTRATARNWNTVLRLQSILVG